MAIIGTEILLRISNGRISVYRRKSCNTAPVVASQNDYYTRYCKIKFHELTVEENQQIQKKKIRKKLKKTILFAGQ